MFLFLLGDDLGEELQGSSFIYYIMSTFQQKIIEHPKGEKKQFEEADMQERIYGSNLVKSLVEPALQASQSRHQLCG